MKSWFCAALVMGLTTSAFAGKKVKPSTEFWFDDAMTGDVLHVSTKDTLAIDAVAKSKLTYINQTDDYIIVDTSGVQFRFPNATVQPNGASKHWVIEPRGKKAKVWEAEGSGFQVESFSIEHAEVFRAPAQGAVVAAPDFRLPVEDARFTAGGFACSVPKKIKQETDETAVRFSCTYSGDGIGVIDPARIKVRIESGEAYANDDRKMKPIVAEKGDTVKFDAVFHISARVIDMQFATMFIQWGETFTESKMTPITVDPLVVKFREQK